jgi:hypothetical protein
MKIFFQDIAYGEMAVESIKHEDILSRYSLSENVLDE